MIFHYKPVYRWNSFLDFVFLLEYTVILFQVQIIVSFFKWLLGKVYVIETSLDVVSTLITIPNGSICTKTPICLQDLLYFWYHFCWNMLRKCELLHDFHCLMITNNAFSWWYMPNHYRCSIICISAIISQYFTLRFNYPFTSPLT